MKRENAITKRPSRKNSPSPDVSQESNRLLLVLDLDDGVDLDIVVVDGLALTLESSLEPAKGIENRSDLTDNVCTECARAKGQSIVYPSPLDKLMGKRARKD